MDKEELLAHIRDRREQLEIILAGIKDRFEEPGLPGGWTVKDLLAHLCFWEQSVFEAYSLLRLGETPARLDHGLPIDDLNAVIRDESRKLPLDEVIRQENEAYHNLLGLVEQAPADELFDPGRFAWTKGESMATVVTWNTWEHYDEHLANLREWLAGE